MSHSIMNDDEHSLIKGSFYSNCNNYLWANNNSNMPFSNKYNHSPN